MSVVKKKKVPAPNVAVFGRVKTQLGTIGDPLVVANVVNHILNKRFALDLSEALDIYADPQEKARILHDLGFATATQDHN
jgi:hypothetical protein